MADKKNQHFVPKCYLRSFSNDSQGSSVNLYNIARHKAVQNASIRGQCSRNYFYGQDLKIEDALSNIEGMYATSIKKLQQGDAINADDIYIFKAFSFLQYFRTEQNIEILKLQHKNFVDAIMEGPNINNLLREMTHSDFVEQAINVFSSSLHLVEDLDYCICDNECRREFITSDDPVTISNKFTLQKAKQETFGLASSGIIYFFPLSPRYLFMMYDPNIYFIKKHSHFVSISPKDVESLNELQYIRARENIYFSDWNIRNVLPLNINKYRARRPDKWNQTQVLIKDTSFDSQIHSRYKAGTPQEIKESKDSIISLRPVHFYPSRWASVIQYKMRPVAFSNGSSVGYVRPAVAERRMLGHED